MTTITSPKQVSPLPGLKPHIESVEGVANIRSPRGIHGGPSGVVANFSMFLKDTYGVEVHISNLRVNERSCSWNQLGVLGLEMGEGDTVDVELAGDHPKRKLAAALKVFTDLLQDSNALEKNHLKEYYDRIEQIF